MIERIRKSNKGITLIALVITIIVLLILAGVAIMALTGDNGILNRANDAAVKTDVSQTKEQIYVELISKNDDGSYTVAEVKEIAKKITGNEVTDNKVKTKKGNEVDLTDIIAEATDGTGGPGETGKIEVGKEAPKQGTINDEAGTYNNPTVPKGYYPINTDSAKWDAEGGPQVDKGLVISDKATGGNEWVWVPVQNATAMYETADPAIALTGSTGVTTGKYSKSIISGQTRGLPNSTSYREPDILSASGYDGSNYSTAGFTSLANMAQAMVKEYSDMIDSVGTYGGFYIGRYELTAEGEKPGATLVKTSWYNLYKNCKDLSKTDSNTTARMIWGCQWDVTCNWIANNGDKKSITDSSSWGNYKNTAVKSSDGNTTIKNANTSTKLETGITTFTMANNIYDLAGNCYEWTQEANVTVNRAVRGGHYLGTGSDYPVAYRSYTDPTFDAFVYIRFSPHFNVESLSP